MSEIRLLALDLDGTLTNSDKKISAINKRSIRQAQDMGVEIVLASGRPLIGVAPIADELDLWNQGGYILAYNGGHIIDCKAREDIVRQTVPMEYVHDICSVTDSFEAYPLGYDANGVICESDTDIYVLKEAFCNGVSVRKVDSLENALAEPMVKFLIAGEPSELQRVHSYLSDKFAGKLNLFFSEPYFLEITPPGVEKSSALARLVSHLGLTKDNLMACGDGLNDISMLEYAGLSVAMENAYDETKQHADFITLSNDEDGVAHAIERFILNKG